jgi:predicted chitinase
MQLKALTAIPDGPSRLIKDLNADQLTELQTALVYLGYPAGDIDGKYGPKTRNAWAEFIADRHEGDPEAINAESVRKLQHVLDEGQLAHAHDFSTQNGTIAAIQSECVRQGLGLKSQIAYVLATTDHETNHTFKPVTEAYWLPNPDAYLKQHHADYYPYYGRGYVQLTWKNNYEKYGTLLHKDLVGHPELALEPEIALFVLVHGFKTGAFTGRKITDYIDAQKTDFVNARRCINGLDRAQDIAAIAKKYLATL